MTFEGESFDWRVPQFNGAAVGIPGIGKPTRRKGDSAIILNTRDFRRMDQCRSGCLSYRRLCRDCIVCNWILDCWQAGLSLSITEPLWVFFALSFIFLLLFSLPLSSHLSLLFLFLFSSPLLFPLSSLSLWQLGNGPHHAFNLNTYVSPSLGRVQVFEFPRLSLPSKPECWCQGASNIQAMRKISWLAWALYGN